MISLSYVLEKMKFVFVYFSLTSLLIINGCLGVPTGIAPVKSFDVKRYLGKWYEIARLDHSFERGLTNVTAEYSLRADGGIDVVNVGYSSGEGKWDRAIGKAYFVDQPDLAYLKVSFFGPFYSSYVVFDLGENYEYAFVSGNSKSYLWLLARSPQASEALIDKFRTQAKKLGYDVDSLIFVDQSMAHSAGT